MIWYIIKQITVSVERVKAGDNIQVELQGKKVLQENNNGY